MTESGLLAAALAGDEDAFAALVGPHRRGLAAHCYRMLGSHQDAEDALQEALLRAWRGLGQFEGRSSLRAWLYMIATNACLRTIERRPQRVLPTDFGPNATDPHGHSGVPLAETVWIEPYPDHGLAVVDERAAPDTRYELRESVELAFVAALQHLPAQQRAVLILRDVLGFSGAEVADQLATSTDAVYSSLQRAHKSVDARLPERSQQATLRALGDERLRELAAVFVDAWERADVDALAATLAEDVVLAMPPVATWFRGRGTVTEFVRARPLNGTYQWRLVPTSANGQPAFGVYEFDEKAHAYLPHGIAVLTIEGDLIGEMCFFRDPRAVERFGLEVSKAAA